MKMIIVNGLFLVVRKKKLLLDAPGKQSNKTVEGVEV